MKKSFNARRRPFGSLAQRTVGDLYGAKDVARCGLELSFDSILRGTNGIENAEKSAINISALPKYLLLMVPISLQQ